MNVQDITYPIELSFAETELILAGLVNLPKKDADPIFAKIQQTAVKRLEEVQAQGAKNPEVQAEINQAEANSDSMRNE